MNIKLPEQIIDHIKSNESKFISLKYIDAIGSLKQIDFLAQRIAQGLDTDHDPLFPIANKFFVDPFRSQATTSIFCENVSNVETRKLIADELKDLNIEIDKRIYLEISFWVEESNNSNNLNSLYLSDPYDSFSNLRSDIVLQLEQAGIATTTHHHGASACENIIGIKGKNILDIIDNYVIARFFIVNIARSYGLSICFSAKTSNITLYFSSNRPYKSNEDDMNILSYFVNNKASVKSKFYSNTAEAKKNCKLYLNISDSFNPYLTLAPLMIYNAHEDFSFKKFCKLLKLTDKIV